MMPWYLRHFTGMGGQERYSETADVPAGWLGQIKVPAIAGVRRADQ